MIKIKIKGARGSGKTTIAHIISTALLDHGFEVDVYDGRESFVSTNNKDIIDNIAIYQTIQIKVDN